MGRNLQSKANMLLFLSRVKTQTCSREGFLTYAILSQFFFNYSQSIHQFFVWQTSYPGLRIIILFAKKTRDWPISRNVQLKNLFSLSSQGNKEIKLKYHDAAKKRALNSEPMKTPSRPMMGPAKDKNQAMTK